MVRNFSPLIKRYEKRNLAAITAKRWETDMWLLLDTNMKPYMRNQMALSDLTLSDLERSKSKLLRFQSLIWHKGAELRTMLLLTINRKPYMAIPMTSSLLTLSDFERSKSRSLGFQSLISCKETKVLPTVGYSLG